MKLTSNSEQDLTLYKCLPPSSSLPTTTTYLVCLHSNNNLFVVRQVFSQSYKNRTSRQKQEHLFNDKYGADDGTDREIKWQTSFQKRRPESTTKITRSQDLSLPHLFWIAWVLSSILTGDLQPVKCRMYVQHSHASHLTYWHIVDREPPATFIWSGLTYLH